MLEMISEAIQLATAISTLVNTEAVLSAAKELASLQNSLREEYEKGYDSDDAKIESYYEQIRISLQKVNNEYALFQTAKLGSSPASPIAH